ncbi:MAG TPA: hypothetical protein VM032_07010 [Vicinamibacterales bacterium]|nr:hypothetical protein [Vicinamibacterales bacterium]
MAKHGDHEKDPDTHAGHEQPFLREIDAVGRPSGFYADGCQGAARGDTERASTNDVRDGAEERI